MCTICGCGTDSIAEKHADHAPGSRVHNHTHTHGRSRESGGIIDFGAGPAGAEVPGLSQQRTIRIEREILSKNAAFAGANRARLQRDGVFALNLVSSPGAGKTSLLVRAIEDLKHRFPIAVIEGDQQTSNDADRIRATGIPAVQINTGKGCHLDAHMVGHALDHLPPAGPGLLFPRLLFPRLLFIENVGNLVCPAAFDLGEAHKVVVLSVTEGEDKPLKYPDMFAAADLMLLTKTDLLPYLDFDVGACLAAARRANPRIEILLVSSKGGDGMTDFYDWIEARVTPAARQGFV